MRWLDLTIIGAYMVAMAWLGWRFSRRTQTADAYFTARNALPPWAIGMSIMTTLVSSVAFIAYPGSAYGGNWSLLVPAFMMAVVLAMIGRVIVPFYREAVRMSAYEYFGQRFGNGVRIYGSVAFSLGHFGKMGFVSYLVALTVNSMTGWDQDWIIAGVGVVTVFYTVAGGLEGVLWTDVIQGFIMWVGLLLALGYLMFLPPGGPAAAFALAWDQNKFSLGSMDLDLSRKTIPTLALYGFFWYLQKYTADQTLVQRYLSASSHAAALNAARIGVRQTLPVWILFMLIGTFTWAFYRLSGVTLPAHVAKADQVFPYFLATELPAGVSGVFMAALMAAAMSTLASDLNCIAAVGVADVYKLARPAATDRQQVRAGRILIAVFGLLGTAMAEVLLHASQSALSLWFSVSAILSGGLAGLFLLAFVTRRANRRGVWTGIIAAILFTAWATATSTKAVNLGGWNYPWDDLTIGAVAHVVLFVVGYLASLAFGAPEHVSGPVTVQDWWRRARAPS